MNTTRRQLLGATTLFAVASLVGSGPVQARTVTETLPWLPNEAYPPRPAGAGPLVFFRPEEAAAVDAMLARLIPADDLGPGAKETGGTVFIDRQLAGPYGGHEWLYMQGPFPDDPLPSQGLQSPLTPRQEYRQGLVALAEHCRANFGGKLFQQVAAADQDRLLGGMEKGEVAFKGANARAFFNLVQANAIEGFFADPIYGGNQDMVGWKLVGFPGSRYDYRDVMANPNKPYTMPPVALMGRPEWGKRS